MASAIAALAFDLDGTLVDSMGRLPEVYVRVIRLAGGPAVEVRDVVGAFHVGSTADLLAHFLGRAVTEAELSEFYDLMAEAVRGVRVFDGVPEMLSTLKADAVPLGLFTGAARRTTELLLEGCELSHVFEAVVAGDEVSRPKPCSEGLLMVCDHLGLAPASVVYVGDMQADIDCAREAGCVAVLAGWAAEPDQVSGAAFVAPTPSALVELVNAQGHGCPDGPFL